MLNPYGLLLPSITMLLFIHLLDEDWDEMVSFAEGIAPRHRKAYREILIKDKNFYDCYFYG